MRLSDLRAVNVTRGKEAYYIVKRINPPGRHNNSDMWTPHGRTSEIHKAEMNTVEKRETLNLPLLFGLYLLLASNRTSKKSSRT